MTKVKIVLKNGFIRSIYKCYGILERIKNIVINYNKLKLDGNLINENNIIF